MRALRMLLMVLLLALTATAQAPADSAKKYLEIAQFYENYNDAAFTKYWYKYLDYQQKVDSLNAIEVNKQRQKEKKLLEIKYKMKLPN